MNINKILFLLAILMDLPAGAQGGCLLRSQWLMGTVCEIKACGAGASRAISGAFSEIQRWDRVMSLYKEDSELSEMNRRASLEPFPCSESLWEAISTSLRHAASSGGAFDPSILPILRRGPSAMEMVGYRKIKTDPAKKTVHFMVPGMALDLGGIGKGIALDHAARVLRRRGISSAFINFGGQIYALGSPAGSKGWKVLLPGRGELLLKDTSASTSGNSEQPGHILSPFDGRPVMGQESVTVLSSSAAAADAWSTALFVLGGKHPPGFKACAIISGVASGPTCGQFKAVSPRGGSS
jgi:thiamine biosynthesis lipoprotein